MKNRHIIIFFLSSVILTSCNNELATTNVDSDTYYLLTTLGSDTLAIEKIVSSSDSILATVVLRSPKTRVISYGYAKNQQEDAFYRAIIEDPISGGILNTELVRWQNDSLLISMNQGETEKLVPASKDILPFIDMVHWPFDLMLSNLKEAKSPSLSQQVWSGTRTFNFGLTRVGEDSATIKHPSRGIMGVKLNETGQLKMLDASQTTRKLVVTREDRLDFDVLMKKFIEADKSGQVFGALSGRGAFAETINGVTYKIDYGTPAKRGREIWGSLVKYGERWRTGANRATHFSIDKAIKINDLELPAGEYTLFSIPEENSLSLIINTQTGQNGQTYDETLDFGRVEMSRRDLTTTVELFTVRITSRDGNDYLSLEWDNRAYEAKIED